MVRRLLNFGRTPGMDADSPDLELPPAASASSSRAPVSRPESSREDLEFTAASSLLAELADRLRLRIPHAEAIAVDPGAINQTASVGEIRDSVGLKAAL